MIEIHSLVKAFGTFHALDGISFQIDRGSIFGLVGSNGAGKSTLLRTLSGIYAPDGGDVTIDGAPPFENPALKAVSYTHLKSELTKGKMLVIILLY